MIERIRSRDQDEELSEDIPSLSGRSDSSVSEGAEGGSGRGGGRPLSSSRVVVRIRLVVRVATAYEAHAMERNGYTVRGDSDLASVLSC